MMMTPGLRKLAFTAHVTFSVGWLGAVAVFLVLAVVGLISPDAQTVRAAYLTMQLIGWFVIVPCSISALLSGLVQSLGTPWGLFRHYWTVVKLLLTIGATILLILHMGAADRLAAVAAGTTLSITDLRALQIQLVSDAGLALLVLLAVTTVSVYKPWGLTEYGRRKERSDSKSDNGMGLTPNRRTAGASVGRYVWIALIGVALLVVAVHLAGGGMRGH